MTLALLLAVLSFRALADTLTGKVVKVADGDTITELVDREQHRVRLTGIDTPERGQPYGKAAGRALAALVAGKVVAVEYFTLSSGRTLATLRTCWRFRGSTKNSCNIQHRLGEEGGDPRPTGA